MEPESGGSGLQEAGRRFIAQAVARPLQSFIRTEAASGIILLAGAIIALLWVNSPWDESYFDLWHQQLSIDLAIFQVGGPLEFWVNDGLMAIFFFVVGMEIKRELAHGELSTVRRAALPAAAALGGMIVPALIFTAFNAGGDGQRGWGIPMATDIAFALGVLSLLGRRVPFGVKVFLLGLAIVDDIGAIVVIAVFYTEELAVGPGAWALALLGAIVLANRGGVRNVYVYIVLGGLLWVAVLKAGIHPTIAGVVLGLLAPARPFYSVRDFVSSAERVLALFRQAAAEEDTEVQAGALARMEDLAQGTESPLDRLERGLHPWSSFLIVPIFALANSGVVLNGDILGDAASSPITLGVALGLVAGKLSGILGFAWLAVRSGMCDLPTGATWSHLAGAALLGGIGFTVAIFITGLAYDDPALVDEAKIGILAASLVAGVLGYLFLRTTTRPAPKAIPASPPGPGAAR
ncbi:MAG: Na+/H+ antiporter NhaA [Dehalococcoidia bacterium]